MAPNGLSTSPLWGPPASYDKRRTPEFRRYYEPLRAMTIREPLWTDLHDDDAVARHKAVSSPDKALTAFCQLAAHKLNVRRAMIFLFDANYGYILAEATRTLSLRDDDRHADGDQLWLGHARIPRGFSVCEHTVNLCPPAPNTGEPRGSDTASLAHIITDLAGDARFCGRAYVTDGPRLRSYAGVPITTPAGHNIGALCALHDEPRATEPSDVDLLLDLSAAIMSHLDAVRAKAEARRRDTMLTGLTAFGERVGELRDDLQWACRPNTPMASIPGVRSSVVRNEVEVEDQAEVLETGPSPGSPASQQDSVVADSTATSSMVQDHTIGNMDAQETVSDASIGRTGDLDLTQGIRRVYQLAADTLQQAVAVDGVIFLDDTAMYNSINNTFNSEKRPSVVVGPTTSSSMSSAFEENGSQPARSRRSDDMCICMAASYAAARPSPIAENPEMSRRMLASLSRRYAQGKIWRFAPDEDVSDSSVASIPSSSGPSVPSTPAVDTQPPTEGRVSRRRAAEHAAAVRQLFPTAESIMFLPLWDASSSRRCSGVFLYVTASSSSRSTAFSSDVDLQFLRAFCDVVLAEAGRLGSAHVLHSKSAFVASVSHELRTPLHGILGNAEYLREHIAATANDDPVPGRLVAQIEICGQTMLDTINHVLDFAHIEQAAHKQGRNQQQNPSLHSASSDDSAVRAGRSNPGSARTRQRASRPFLGAIQNHAPSGLDRVTEKVIDSAVHAFHWKQNPNPSSAGVMTILEIQRDANTDWTNRLSTGAWNRICINLIGNALKYTTDGYVHVTLRQEQQDPESTDGPPGPATALLTVTDTGCGMAPEFMQSSLFKPFEQEDAVADGTGLGLSLVAKILKSIGGQIRVQSSRGAGTSVFVSVPLVQSSRRAARCAEARGQSPPTTEVDTTKQRIETASESGAPAELAAALPGTEKLIIAHFSPGFDDTDSIPTAGVQQDGDSPPQVTAATLRRQGHQLLRSALTNVVAQVSARIREHTPTLATTESIHVNIVLDEDLSESNPAKRSGTADTTHTAGNRPCIVVCSTFQKLRRCMAARVKSSRASDPTTTAAHVEYVVQPCGPVQFGNALGNCLRAVAPSLSLPPGLLTASKKAPPAAAAAATTPRSPGWRRSHPAGTRARASPAMTPDSSESHGALTPSRLSSAGDVQDGYFASRSRASSKPAGATWQSIAAVNVTDLPTPPAVTPLPMSLPICTPAGPPLPGTSTGAADPPAIGVHPAHPPPPPRRGLSELSPRPSDSPPARTTSRQDLLILLVDDNDVNMRLLKMFAERQRFRYLAAENGLRALELYQAGFETDQHRAASGPPQCPQVILMDISMPVMDGFEATRRIRALEAAAAAMTPVDAATPAPRALIIAMTGLGSATAEREAQACGMDHFLTKPVRMKAVAALLETTVWAPSQNGAAVPAKETASKEQAVIEAKEVQA